MKYCPKCGAQLADEAAFCDKCGTDLGQPAAPPEGGGPVQKGGSGLSIAALILAILGFLTGFLGIGLVLDVIAIVLAVLVFIQAKKKPIKTGMATGGLIVAVLSILLCGVLLGPALWSELNKPSQEEMLAEATTVDLREMAIEHYENNAAFAEKYDGEILKVTGYVENISDWAGVTLVWTQENQNFFTNEELERMNGDAFFATQFDITVNFSNEEDMIRLEKGSEITVVGTFDSFTDDLNDAYLVTG